MDEPQRNYQQKLEKKRISREEALNFVKKYEGKFPIKYLDRDLEAILKDINMSISEFIKICDKFTNKNIFEIDKNGNLIKDNTLSLKKINYDN